MESTSSSSSSIEAPTPSAEVTFYPYRFSHVSMESSQIPLRGFGATVLCAFSKASRDGKDIAKNYSRQLELKNAQDFFVACIATKRSDAVAWIQLFILGKKILKYSDSITERELLDISSHLLSPFEKHDNLRVDMLTSYKELLMSLVAEEKRQRRASASAVAISSLVTPSSLTRILQRVRESIDVAQLHPRARLPHTAAKCTLCASYPLEKKQE